MASIRISQAIFLVAMCIAISANLNLLSSLEESGNENVQVRSKRASCQFQKNPNMKFIGNMIAILKKVDSADKCGQLCWDNLAINKKLCKSANYMTSTKQCDLIDSQLDPSNPSMVKYYTETNNDATYVIPYCSESGPAPSTPAPITTPAPPKPIPSGSCGKGAYDIKSNPIQRIVGGIEARPHSFPWIVSMQRYAGISFCGGTLLRVNNADESDIVVTAGHCVEDNSRKISVVAGAHSSSRPEEGSETVEVQKIVTHPKYRIKTLNDIAIMKLVKPIKFGPWIQPACLPTDKIADGTTVIASGWGKSNENGSSPNELNQVYLGVVNTQECNDALKKQSWPLAIQPDMHLCAGVMAGGKDTCQGDSGGPLVAKGSDGYVLQGVVSFGVGCARPNSPGVYARVANFVPWIKEQIAALSTVKASG